MSNDFALLVLMIGFILSLAVAYLAAVARELRDKDRLIGWLREENERLRDAMPRGWLPKREPGNRLTEYYRDLES